MTEVKVKKEVGKEVGKEPAGLVRWPGFETPLFRGSLFNMNPFALMRRFTEEMDQAFSGMSLAQPEAGLWSPTLEVKEKDGKLLVCAELPGLKKDDIKVEVTEDSLILEGERKQEKEEKREAYYHSERSYGRFYRSIPLPEGAQVDKASAEFTDGVLQVSVPIPRVERKLKEIPIQEVTKAQAA